MGSLIRYALLIIYHFHIFGVFKQPDKKLPTRKPIVETTLPCLQPQSCTQHNAFAKQKYCMAHTAPLVAVPFAPPVVTQHRHDPPASACPVPAHLLPPQQKHPRVLPPQQRWSLLLTLCKKSTRTLRRRLCRTAERRALGGAQVAGEAQVTVGARADSDLPARGRRGPRRLSCARLT